ncbi:DUF262 domain-containing protein [Nocardioides okcheonensis]|uniref:DUF262 domain-containing protein n=1 Tax=Nocardioides okcheonensis TaxID=2894081 RepID=UPI001E39E89B|nr:DUF262 domain-containing HNH endonuclease family protein [Nocardioides okcheonensis]UFN46439.1 DUF262 domain-containing HNH endonuclease family protein [Nocardioides okcheonensis]
MTTTDVDALFKPTSASVRQLLSDLVGGFSIPSYQRPYRWLPADMRRLCEDLIAGLDRLVKDPSAVAFVGAIITVSGAGDDHPTTPSDARQIIDGQQRLTTVVMLAVALHEYLGRIHVKLGRDTTLPATETEWFNEHISEVRGQLYLCLSDQKSYGDEDFKKLPKLTRGITDRWSNRASTARYLSPIANLIHGYLKHPGPGTYIPERPTVEVKPESTGSSPADFEYLHLRYQQLKRMVRDIAKGSDGDLADSIDLQIILGSGSSVLEALFRTSAETAPALRALSQTKDDVGQALRLLVFARFLLERVAVTQINAKDESYAFDLFDSLNTTGEPLTAFETFVPLVVQAEGVESYAASESFEHIALTSRLLSADEGNVQRQTERLMTSFILADAGVKVASKHNEQRRELTRLYRTAENDQQRRAMTRQLADCALCYFHLWQRLELARGATGVEGSLDEESLFALRFLARINHTIALAPLSRYYSQWVADPTPESVSELETAIKASTAFSVLWRTAHGGTDGIDGVYRRLMSHGCDGICAPLARTDGQNHDVRPLPPAQDLVKAYRHVAAHANTFPVTNLDAWLTHSSARPIYDDQAELSRFLLLVAGHHAVADGTTGLTKDGQVADHTAMLRADRYTSDDRLATVEHVAPQTPEDGHWQAEIYRAPSAVSTLGNLTLLPVDDNSFISNRPWSEKRSIYGALSADAPDETKAVLEAAVAGGLSLSADKQEYLVERRQHLPMLRAISQYSGDWDRDFIESRTKHLLTRAWSKLDEWLTPDE